VCKLILGHSLSLHSIECKLIGYEFPLGKLIWRQTIFSFCMTFFFAQNEERWENSGRTREFTLCLLNSHWVQSEHKLNIECICEFTLVNSILWMWVEFSGITHEFVVGLVKRYIHSQEQDFKYFSTTHSGWYYDIFLLKRKLLLVLAEPYL